MRLALDGLNGGCILGRMTVPQLIFALGGNTALARTLGISPQAVANWTRRGAIPARRHYQVARLARALGLHIDPERMQ
jgi:hypothetical protein